jgi:hypothetical protein
VQQTWKETSHFFGVRFGYFCERKLQLPRVERPAPSRRSATPGALFVRSGSADESTV